MSECLFELCLGSSLTSGIEVFEFREESICSLVTREEPAKCCDRRVHATGSIDTWSYLESYEVCIIFSDSLSSFEEFPETTGTRLSHLGEPKGSDDTILSYYRHTV